MRMLHGALVPEPSDLDVLPSRGHNAYIRRRKLFPMAESARHGIAIFDDIFDAALVTDCAAELAYQFRTSPTTMNAVMNLMGGYGTHGGPELPRASLRATRKLWPERRAAFKAALESKAPPSSLPAVAVRVPWSLAVAYVLLVLEGGKSRPVQGVTAEAQEAVGRPHEAPKTWARYGVESGVLVATGRDPRRCFITHVAPAPDWQAIAPQVFWGPTAARWR